MAIVKIDATNEQNFQGRKLLPPGSYCFEVANDPEVTTAKTGNPIVNVELRVADDGEHKGAVVYDGIVITPKSEYRLCHLVLAAGTQSKADMAQGIDLSLLKGKIVEAEISVRPPEKDPVSGKTYKEKNTVERYVFEPEK